MSTAEEAAQQRDWQVLHDAITATLDRFGRKDAFGKGDYWLLDDNWGRARSSSNLKTWNCST